MNLKKKAAQFFCFRNYATLAFIFFWFALFTDATWIFRGGEIVSAEAILWTVLANGAFLAFTVTAVLKRKTRIRAEKQGVREYLPLAVCWGTSRRAASDGCARSSCSASG